MSDGIAAALLIGLPILTFIRVKDLFNPTYLSPTLIVCAIFFGIGSIGYLLRDLLDQAGIRGAGINITLTEAQSLQTLRLITIFVTITMLTAAVMLRARVRADSGWDRNQSQEWHAAKPSPILAAVAVVPLLLITLSSEEILERQSYLVGEPGSLIGGLGPTLATAAVVVLGYLFGAKRGGMRSFAILLLISYTLIFFSFGSRRFALIPILFFLGVFVAVNNRRTRIGLLAAAAATFALLPIPIVLRGSVKHGVIPYLEALSDYSIRGADWLGALNSIFVSFPIIGRTAFTGDRVSTSDLWISPNPLPGVLAGWYEIAGRLRLNPYTPMAGLGELANVSWTAVVAFAVCLGLILAWFERVVREALTNASNIYAALLLGIVALFALQMVQYNLRSAVRILLYLTVIELVRRSLRAIHSALGSSAASLKPNPIPSSGKRD